MNLLTTERMSGPDTSSKIKSLEELEELLWRIKADGKRIVQCHGVFDLIHPGHIRHLQAARGEGDILIVTVTADRYVNKGPGRPVFNQRLRAESLASLQFVDYVCVNDFPTAVESILRLKPHLYVKGVEYAKPEQDMTGKITQEEEAVRLGGGRIHFTDEITFSSSKLLNDYFRALPTEVENWLKSFRRRHTREEISGYLAKARGMKVLVVGEAIVDEYIFCEGLGKSTKDPVLAVQYRSAESYPGGSLAVANHLAGFCEEVGLITLLGGRGRREEFVRKALLPPVRPTLLTQRGAPTIHKRRFVDVHTGARMFELYLMEDTPLEPKDETELSDALSKCADRYDLVILADYGHGMLTPQVVSLLCKKARFLAVNTQANAGNRGFNAISKYPRADYVCLAGHEIALETRMRHAPRYDLILEVTKRIDCPRFTVTFGKDGTIHYEPEVGFTEVPAFATHVTDRVGAGDAVLAVTPLLVAQKAPWEVVGFVGNIAGAQVVENLGNRVTVNRPSLERQITALLK